MAAMHGITVAALGMLSTIATGLAINAYGPISYNAGASPQAMGQAAVLLQSASQVAQMPISTQLLDLNALGVPGFTNSDAGVLAITFGLYCLAVSKGLAWVM